VQNRSSPGSCPPTASVSRTVGAVSYQLADGASIVVERADGARETVRGNALGATDSLAVFMRNGKISRLTVLVPRTDLRP